MNCSDWERRIALYAGGDLDAAAAQLVERHVAECAGCQMLLGGLRESLNFLRQGHSDPIEEAHLTSVRAGVMTELRGRIPWWRQVWVYGVAAAAVLLFVLARPASGPAPKVAITPPLTQPMSEIPAPAPEPNRRRRIETPAARKKAPEETVLVKLETNDPDVVIYWISETKGDTK